MLITAGWRRLFRRNCIWAVMIEIGVHVRIQKKREFAEPPLPS